MTFQEWWDSRATDIVGKAGIRGCVERAWNAAMEEAIATLDKRANQAEEDAESCHEEEDEIGSERCDAIAEALSYAAEDLGLLKVDSEWTRDPDAEIKF